MSIVIDGSCPPIAVVVLPRSCELKGREGSPGDVGGVGFCLSGDVWIPVLRAGILTVLALRRSFLSSTFLLRGRHCLLLLLGR